jgi:exopolysaccharide biosynthesis operon protein EpsL
MRLWHLLGLVLLTLAPRELLAALDPTDTIQIQTSATLLRDNNLFRLPDMDPRLFGIDPSDKADTVRVLGVGLKFDKLISRQRLIADVNLNDTKYHNNKNLDHNGGEGRLAWLWRVGNYWDGEIGYRKKRTLAGFADFVDRSAKDLVDMETKVVSAGYLFHPRWRIAAELSDQDSEHSASNRSSLDYEAKAALVSLTYRTPSDNSVALHVRRTDREYPRRVSLVVDTGHVEDRVNAIAVWHPTGLLRLEGQVGYVDLRQDTFSVRDFSGTTWRAGATWDATGKFRLSAYASRDIRLYEDFETSYVVADAFGISPILAVTSKITLQGDFTYENRDFRGDPGFLLFPRSREDKVRTGRISLLYSPIRNVDIGLTYEVGERNSNIFGSDYDYKTWFGTLRLGF